MVVFSILLLMASFSQQQVIDALSKALPSTKRLAYMSNPKVRSEQRFRRYPKGRRGTRRMGLTKYSSRRWTKNSFAPAMKKQIAYASEAKYLAASFSQIVTGSGTQAGAVQIWNPYSYALTTGTSQTSIIGTSVFLSTLRARIAIGSVAGDAIAIHYRFVRRTLDAAAWSLSKAFANTDLVPANLNGPELGVEGFRTDQSTLDNLKQLSSKWKYLTREKCLPLRSGGNAAGVFPDFKSNVDVSYKLKLGRTTKIGAVSGYSQSAAGGEYVPTTFNNRPVDPPKYGDVWFLYWIEYAGAAKYVAAAADSLTVSLRNILYYRDP